MRILLANDGFGDAGGVQNYLDALAAGLSSRGHALAILHRDATPAPFAAEATRSLPQFSVARSGIAPTLDEVNRWNPDLCFSHNMNVLAVDRGLMARWPVVKFMHGYLGTCIGGQKRFGFPTLQPCDRRFGLPCLALYGPRHCGELNVGSFVRHYQWALEQHGLLRKYRTIVVASEHMRREYIRNGVAPSQVQVNQLFPTHIESARGIPAPAAPQLESDSEWTVAFVGRMTVLKGGDLLVHAIADASASLERTIRLLLIGDGPQRGVWERLASERGVPCSSLGWLSGNDRWDSLRRAHLIAVPSTWPEPFGLVGLEAAALGIPAVAFDVGGIREWLRPGVNGVLVPADPPTSAPFADALVQMFSNPATLRALGSGAIEVAQEMTLDRHLDRLEAILAPYVQPHAHPAGR
jgi:glycosyltransferase involved in cell wall biosynthesis